MCFAILEDGLLFIRTVYVRILCNRGFKLRVDVSVIGLLFASIKEIRER